MYAEAERYFVLAEIPSDAVRMYAKNNMWDEVFRVAEKFVSVLARDPIPIRFSLIVPMRFVGLVNW